MKRNAKVWVTADGAGGFFRRAREHARKLDRGEPIAPEITVTFEDVRDLANGLQRDTRAVSRDVDLLESFGLLRTRYEKNPGHGRRRIVESCAANYQLLAAI